MYKNILKWYNLMKSINKDLLSNNCNYKTSVSTSSITKENKQKFDHGIKVCDFLLLTQKKSYRKSVTAA